MADRTVRAVITGSSAGAIRAAREAAAAFDTAGTTIGDKMDKASSRVGGGFSKMGASVENFTGIPVAGFFDKFGSKIEETDSKGQRLGKTLGALGGGLVLGGAAGLMAVGVASVDMASKFQSSMELIHTQAGASQSEVEKMKGAVLDLAGPTATAPEELAAGLYHLESAGMRGSTALGALKIAAEGAKVGHANLEDVTNALNATIASGIPGVHSMSGAMGSLNAIVGSGDMRMQDLADAMGTGVLAAVKGFGLNLNDVGAALATFGDNNIRGQNAAQALRQAVMAFAKPAKSASAALGSIGMSTDQLGKDMQTGGLNKAITDLHSHLVAAGDDGVKAGALLTNAFGKKAGVGIQVLEDQFGRFQQKTHDVSDGAGHFGEAWKSTTNTLSFQMQQAKATAEALGTKFGTFLIPKLEMLMKAIEGVVAWLTKHKTVAMALGIAVAAIGAAMIAMWIANTIAAMSFWTAATGGIILLVAAIGLAIAWIVKNWAKVSAFFKKWWPELLTIFTGGISLIVGMIMQHWGAIVHFFTGAWSAVAGFFSNLWNTIIGALSTAIDAVVGFFTRLPGRIVGALGDIVTTIWGALKASAAWIDTNVLQPVISYFVQLPGRVVTGLGNIVAFIWQKLVQSGAWIDANVFQPVISYFVQLPGRLVAGLGNIVGTVFGGLVGAWDWIKSNVYDPIVNGFKGLPGDIASAVGSALGALGRVGADVINTVIDGLNTAINFVNDHIPSILGHKILPSLPDIPHLATGGIVHAQPGGVLALLGEGGRDEAVVPLGGNTTSHASSATNTNYITVNVQGGDPQAVVNALRQYIQRNGSLANAGVA